jgi:hypothetical protein
MTVVQLSRVLFGLLAASLLFCLYAVREAFTLEMLAVELRDPPRSGLTEAEPQFVMSPD